jgi:hypothetical protein
VSPTTGSTPADGLSRDAAALEGELAGVIVQALNLELTPAQIVFRSLRTLAAHVAQHRTR